MFYKNISHAQKAQKAQKAPKAPKAPKAQKAQKSQKAQKAQRRNQAKVQNATSEQKKCAQKTSKGKKVTYSIICIFVFFVRAKKRKQKIENRKKRKVATMQCKCTGLTKYAN